MPFLPQDPLNGRVSPARVLHCGHECHPVVLRQVKHQQVNAAQWTLKGYGCVSEPFTQAHGYRLPGLTTVPSGWIPSFAMTRCTSATVVPFFNSQCIGSDHWAPQPSTSLVAGSSA